MNGAMPSRLMAQLHAATLGVRGELFEHAITHRAAFSAVSCCRRLIVGGHACMPYQVACSSGSTNDLA